jgi:hypothetical protein
MEMTTYEVTGVVPTPTYDPVKPYFSHHESTAPKGTKPYEIGEAGRKIKATTESKETAAVLKAAFEKVLKDVEVTEK